MFLAFLRGILLLIVFLIASSCSGGNAPSVPTPPPPPPTLAVTLSKSVLQAAANEGENGPDFSFDADYTGASTDSVVPDISFDPALFSLASPISNPSANKFSVNLHFADNQGGGNYSGDITFRLCKEAACTNVYQGSTQTLHYDVTVWLDDWYTFQRNTHHTAYVHLTVLPDKIQKKWEYTHPTGVTRVAADRERVYFTGYGTGINSSTNTIAALNLSDGSPAWNYDLGTRTYVGAPAISNGAVFVASMVTSSGSNPITALDATDGTYLRDMLFPSQWATFMAPTPIDDELYFAAGYYGNEVFSWQQSTGNLRWSSHGSGYNVWDTEAPAVDDKFAYFYTGESLDVFDRTNGTTVATIADPYNSWGGYDYDGGPIILSDGSILAYSGTTGGGGYLGSSYNTLRPLVRFDIGSSSVIWRTAGAYRTTPAISNGLIYAARNTPGRLDAINVGDGSVAWSWAAPGSEDLQGDIVVTDNVMFISTLTKIYAVDLATHAEVWSHDAPGVVAIAPGNVLIITEATASSGVLQSDNKIIAYDLR